MNNKLEWNQANETTTHQLTAGTYYPGKVFPFPLDALPSGIQNIAGIVAAYVSGYIKPETLAQGVTALGEFAVTRDDDGQGKGYVWQFAITNDHRVFYWGPFKPKECHYFNLAKAVPVDCFFRRTN